MIALSGLEAGLTKVGRPLVAKENAMSSMKEMLETHPWPGHVDRDVLARCIEACLGCERACTSCADACLSEDKVPNLRKCIRLDLDCADVCATTARMLERQTEYDAKLTGAQLQACREAAVTCAQECERHAEMHKHCQLCAEACRRCEKACGELISAMK